MVDIRSSQPAVARSFDLHSQTGIAQLLVAIRTSAISSTEKNELRDLVFQFSSSDDDSALRAVLERKIAEFQLEPPVPPVPDVPPSPARVLSFGSVRPRPAFSTPKLPTKKSVSITQSVPPSVAPPHNLPTNSHTVQEPNSTQEPAMQQTVASGAQPIFTPPAQTAPAAETMTKNSPTLPPRTDIPESAVTETPAAGVPTMPLTTKTLSPVPIDVVAETQTQSASTALPNTQPNNPTLGSQDLTEKNLSRIREIKASVNEKVGNPVNLVDIDNLVGREYMSALLDAMKKINGGGAGVAAMDRLESAYASVTEVITKHAQKQSLPTPEAPAQPAESTMPVAVKTAIPKTEFAVAEPQSIPPPPPHPAIKIEPMAPAESTPIHSPQVAPTTASQPSRPIEIAVPPVMPVVPLTAPGNATVKTTAVAPITQTAPRRLSPLDLADPTSLDDASVKGDPLFTREVDDGLNQLLSEWSLFKKSGLFGTGPKGTEHPLFKKISNLQIPLLLAGRFEGATQDIKQSITDYMNGWRYEQGIIYQQGETFEHYLRRVIKHIIDLQKKRTAA